MFLVLKGAVELTLADRRFVLGEGDSVEYATSTPHRTVNVGTTTAEVLWIIAPPTSGASELNRYKPGNARGRASCKRQINGRMKMMIKIGQATALALLMMAHRRVGAEQTSGGRGAEGRSGKTLTFVSYGGIFQDGQMAALKEFVDKSGVQLLSDGPTEISKVQAQVESGNVTWDVVDTGDFPPYVHCGKLFQKLDFSKIDISNIPEGQVSECSVPAMNYGVVLMYKTEKYKDNPPKSWKDFFDIEKFPGSRALEGSGDLSGGMIEQALLAAGGIG